MAGEEAAEKACTDACEGVREKAGGADGARGGEGSRADGRDAARKGTCDAVREGGRAQVMARFVGAFFDELMRAGVHDVVVSPGSRSTPLSMVAYEASRREGCDVNLYLDVDERGAAFFALGLAKATGRAVCVVCTSGTALANYYPAVMEAETSRVPLIVLSGDRPLRLQKLGAPQTCDQSKAFSDHVRRFFQAPEPTDDPRVVAAVRQVAQEAVIAAAPGTHNSAPVHVNFYFDEPFVPDLGTEGLFGAGRRIGGDCLPATVLSERMLVPADAAALARFLHERRVIVLAGEGTFSCQALADRDRRDREASALLSFAERFDAPLLADPLSQLRAYGHPAVVSGYDRIMGSEGAPAFDAVIRFGRYPVSKRATQAVESAGAAQIVVDAVQTRDFNSQTTTFVQADPLDFVVALLEADAAGDALGEASLTPNIAQWASLDRARRERMAQAGLEEADGFEGAYVSALIDELPADALLFSANSMAIRAVDAFYTGSPKRLTVLANRGLNGIDGTVSSALGAAQAFDQTVFLTGDLTLLHDLNALALQGEMVLRERAGAPRPSVLVVLLDNNGGAIFDMLPQRSDDPYFERLFLTPQQVDFEQAARAFGVEARTVQSVGEFRRVCRAAWGTPGICLVRVPLPLVGVRDRYDRYW